MISTNRLTAMARLFAQAALDGGWMPAVAALGAATNSGHGEIIFLDKRRHAPLGWWFTGADLVDHAAFAAAGGYRPSANMRVAATAPPMQMVHEAHYEALQPTLPDGAALYDLYVTSRLESGCQTVLLDDANLLVGLTVLRGGADGRTSEADRAVFAALAPFARDAAILAMGIERQGAALLAGAFETTAATAFLLDMHGRIVGRTRSADRLLAAGRLRSVDGRLEAARPAGAALARAIGLRLRPPRDAPPPPLATVALPGGPGVMPLVLDVSALPQRDWSFGGAPAVLVAVRGGALRREGAAAILAGAWDLSEAEAEVAAALAAGRSRADIAAARGVSVETVRAQLRAIFAKAGVGREAELVARAAALIGTV